ncbi:hypothetical protein C8T65DRAFT_635241 [Cerioporus squamosus]|nr:hypothetical protein C8T65DRAFT_635241 [Cerioporus squamosus]
MLLSDLAEDVLRAIISHLLLHRNKGDLANLASISRRMRSVCAPILFSRCVTTCSGWEGIPPESIRPFVQHLIYIGRLVADYQDTFGLELPYLPHLRAVTFRGRNLCGMPWTAFKRCLSLPNITSITMEPTTSFIGIYPSPAHEIGSLPIALTSFCYNPNIWRVLDKDPSGAFPHADESKSPKIANPYATESHSLSPLILRIHETLQSLTLPIEIAPLDRMADLPWPQLRELSLSGQFPCNASPSLLHDFITAVPRLATLSVQLARKSPQGRLSPLGPTSSHGQSLALSSLTLAYPDPNDAIFSIDSTLLKQLSLRDYPRYYYHLGFSDVARCWSAPILSSTECLSVLRRMEMPNLHALELVYETDGDDDALLRHVSSSFPCLTHLELHRYRKDRKQIVPHVHVARMLASAPCLRTVHLNLDFHDNVKLYCENMTERSRYQRVNDARGWELADIFEACPSLEYVALLTHGLDCSFWLQFHPRRCAEPRCTAGPVDSPSLPHFPAIL